MVAPLLLAACERAPDTRGVYRSGPNAIVQGRYTEPVRVWGPEGTQTRVPTPGPSGTTWLGQAGPLWIVETELPAPTRSPAVEAALVERAGFRMQEVLGTRSTGAPDAARQGGVYVRSVAKVRRDHAPPIYVVAATGDEIGAGRWDGPADVRAGENCRAAVGLMDHRGETLTSSSTLTSATEVCAVPVVLPPLDIDGDGLLDVLVYGQNGAAGFRTWFEIDGTTLLARSSETWKAIP